MNRYLPNISCIIALLLLSGRAISQPGSKNFNKTWLYGGPFTFETTFDSNKAPASRIVNATNGYYFFGGNSGICDSAGNPVLISDGFSVYDHNLNIIDGGYDMAQHRFSFISDHWSIYAQSSVILPFGNGKYRLITPTVSDSNCIFNWERGISAMYDLLLYDEIDMNANGGAGKVTKRMEPLLENVRLSKPQMMACRHGDGKSWWLIKQASDTNLVYKFLLTEDHIYGPYLQGFSGDAAHFGIWDVSGQSAFSKDGTKYATIIQGYAKVFVADFDRCTGMFSNPKVYPVPARLTGNPVDTAEKDSSTIGLAFSPSGRYLYVSSFYGVQQFNPQNSNQTLAWTFLSGPDTTWEEFQQYSNLYTGQDGKIYVGNWNGLGAQMSVINNPDQPGLASGFCRKCLRLPGFIIDSVFRFIGVGSPPCMPNYSLGPTTPICYPTGVAPIQKEALFSLYPNPTRGDIKVVSKEPGLLQLFNVSGQAILTIEVNNNSTSKMIHLDRLPPGHYNYRFSGLNNTIKTGQLMIVQ